MKKALVTGLIALFFALIITGTTYGQTINNIAESRSQSLFEKKIPASKQLYLTRDSDVFFRNEISTRAVRNFIREYKNVTDAEWFKSPDGFVAIFNIDSIQTKVFYDKRGDYHFMIRQYF